jgi:hypothetical protein
MRCVYRRNGQKGDRPFTSEARKIILEKLLKTETAFGEPLISDEAILAIQAAWTEEFDVAHSALRIAHRHGRHPRQAA